MTSLFAHGVWLSLVFSHPSVYCSNLPSVPPFGVPLMEGRDLLNNIWSNRCLEYGGQRMSGPTGGTIMRGNGDRRTCRHRCWGN